MGGHSEEAQLEQDALAAAADIGDLIQGALPPGVSYVTLIIVPAECGAHVLCVSNLQSPRRVVGAVRAWLQNTEVDGLGG